MKKSDLISEDRICLNCVTPVKNGEVLLTIHDKEKAESGEDDCIKEICPVCRHGQLVALDRITDLDIVKNAVRGFEVLRD